MNAAAKKTPENIKESFLGLFGADVIRLLTTALLSFIVPLLIHINNSVTDMQLEQARGIERGRQKQVAIDELKYDTRIIRNDISEIKEKDATRDQKLSELEEALHLKTAKY